MRHSRVGLAITFALWFGLGLYLLLASGCNGTQATWTPADAGVDASPCGDACDVAELCVAEDGGYVCEPICANQLHCWSSCCVPLEGTFYNTCRPESICYGDRP